MTRRIPLILVAMALMLAHVLPALAQQPRYTAIKGRLQDSSGAALTGYRIVFKPVGEAHTFISGPTTEAGAYSIALPEGREFIPVGVVRPNGRRIDLPGLPAIRALPGVRRDLQVSTGEATSTPGAEASTPEVPAAEEELPLRPMVPENFAAIEGKIIDSTLRPIAGCRVVFRSSQSESIFISVPSRNDGIYVVSLPQGEPFDVVAVVNPAGKRTALEAGSVTSLTGARHDIALPMVVDKNPVNVARTFAGSDRLFLSFVEDTAIVGRQRYEFELDMTSSDTIDRKISSMRVAFQLGGLPDVELGVKLGYGLGEPDLGLSKAGPTDLEFSGKLNFYRTPKGTTEVGAGFVSELPTGDEDAGLSTDSVRMKLFGAMRQIYGWGVLNAHVGIDGRADGQVAGVNVSGKIAAAAGVALIYRISNRVNLVGEGRFTGETIEGVGSDGRLLVGVNWGVRSTMSVRGALAFGLTDGAPDTQFLAGFAFQFD